MLSNISRNTLFACGFLTWATVPSYAHASELKQAQLKESRNALENEAFYQAPQDGNAPTYPGALIRQERATDYTLPPGVQAYRILYHSLDATRHDVVSSAVVLVPAGPVPAGGWPVVAWAHGTSGVARQCAPSLMKNLYYGNEGLFDFPAHGLAVVATDYHGLGTSGAHQYMNKLAQGYDVIYSVAAARSAVPALGSRWVADGHSQGGMASWSVGEMEHDIADPGYLGTVSVSGTINMPDFVHPLPGEGGESFYTPMVAYGLQARYPQFDPRFMLNDAGMTHYDGAVRQGCWYVASALYDGQSIDSITRKGWLDNKFVQSMFHEDAVGRQPLKGPLLVITGGGDVTVPPEGVRATARTACHNHIPLSFTELPGLDHDPTMIQSTAMQIAWIKDRFSGRPAPENCDSLK